MLQKQHLVAKNEFGLNVKRENQVRELAMRWDPLPRCFFLTGFCEEENGRAQGA